MPSSDSRRLAVEAVVIVTSILLAFSLDAWWDDRQERGRVTELLEAVADDFDREVAALDSVVAANEHGDRILGLLLDVTSPEAGSPSVDTLAALATLVPVPETQVYDPAFGALNALLSSGGIERVRDPELRRRLAGWPAELDDLVWEQSQAYDAVDRLLEGLKEQRLMSQVSDVSQFWRVRVQATTESVSHREDEAHMKLVYKLYTDDLVRVRRRAVELSTLIREHLD